MKRIVIIHITPLLKRLKDAFLIEAYLNAGYHVEYWDVTMVLRPYVKMPDEISEPYVVKYNSFEQFERSIAETNKSETIFILPFQRTIQNSSTFDMLLKHNCHLIRLNIYSDDINKLFPNRKNWRYFFSFSMFKALILTSKTIIYNKLLARNMQVFDHYFACTDPRTHCLNNPTYENFQDIKNEKSRILDGNYILFVDNFFPMHPEFEGTEKRKKAIVRKYYPSMRRFFDWIENKYNVPVIVAAHPSSAYNNNEFGNRKIIKDNTALLVKDADIILMHLSFANIFAILFDKPIVFIKTNQMKFVDGIFSTYRIHNMAESLNKEVYNIDKAPFEKIEFTKIEKTAREGFIYSQITTKENEDRNNEEIVLTEIDKIFKELKKQ